jgi:hypothetical protein
MLLLKNKYLIFLLKNMSLMILIYPLYFIIRQNVKPI